MMIGYFMLSWLQSSWVLWCFFKGHMKNSSGQLHVVLGNESCDIDSMVSALTFAYFLSKVSTSVMYSLIKHFIRNTCTSTQSRNQSVNHVATVQSIRAWRYGSVQATLTIRVGVLSHAPARYSDFYVVFRVKNLTNIWIYGGWKHLVDEIQQKMSRVDWKAAVTWITTLYNFGEQKSIPECTACETFRRMHYNNSFHCCQPRTESWDCSGQRLNKTGLLRTWKTLPAFCQQSRLVEVVLWCEEIISWKIFGCVNTNQSSLKSHIQVWVWVLLLNMCIPSWPQFTHFLTVTSGLRMHHITKQNSFLNGFMNPCHK